MVVARPCLVHAWRWRAPVSPLAGKFRRMRVWFAPLTFAWAAVRCESDLSMESCLVALSIGREEGLFGREPQSWSITVRQRRTIV